MEVDLKPQKGFSPFSADLLPTGFKYPDRFLRLGAELKAYTRLAWWFEDAATPAGDFSWKMRHHWSSEGWKLLDTIDPIPFARKGDWAAYFDGNDHSGDPAVFVADLGNKAHTYKLRNFDEWFAQALEDSNL